MGANAIEVYQENTRTIKCTVIGLANLDGYTATLTVKKTPEDTTTVITKEGSISDLIITFDLTATLTKVDPYEYVYEITLDDETNKYTIVQDIFKVTDSVKF